MRRDPGAPAFAMVLSGIFFLLYSYGIYRCTVEGRSRDTQENADLWKKAMWLRIYALVVFKVPLFLALMNYPIPPARP